MKLKGHTPGSTVRGKSASSWFPAFAHGSQQITTDRSHNTTRGPGPGHPRSDRWQHQWRGRERKDLSQLKKFLQKAPDEHRYVGYAMVCRPAGQGTPKVRMVLATRAQRTRFTDRKNGRIHMVKADWLESIAVFLKISRLGQYGSILWLENRLAKGTAAGESRLQGVARTKASQRLGHIRHFWYITRCARAIHGLPKVSNQPTQHRKPHSKVSMTRKLVSVCIFHGRKNDMENNSKSYLAVGPVGGAKGACASSDCLPSESKMLTWTSVTCFEQGMNGIWTENSGHCHWKGSQQRYQGNAGDLVGLQCFQAWIFFLLLQENPSCRWIGNCWKLQHRNMPPRQDAPAFEKQASCERQTNAHSPHWRRLRLDHPQHQAQRRSNTSRWGPYFTKPKGPSKTCQTFLERVNFTHKILQNYKLQTKHHDGPCCLARCWHVTDAVCLRPLRYPLLVINDCRIYNVQPRSNKSQVNSKLIKTPRPIISIWTSEHCSKTEAHHIHPSRMVWLHSDNMQFFVARNSTGWQALLYSTLNNVRPDKQRSCHQTAWVVNSHASIASIKACAFGISCVQHR